jgi:hypothetical protein
MFLGLMLLGVAAHWGLRRVMAPARERIEAPAEAGLFDRFCGVAFRAVFDLLAMAGFAVVTLGLAVLIFAEKSPDRSFMITYLTGTLIVYGAALAGRFLLAPYAPSLRLAPLGDGAARFLYRWFVLLAAVAVYAWLTAGLLILTGMKLEAHLMVVLLTGAVMAVLITVMILQARAGVGGAGGRHRQPEGTLPACALRRHLAPLRHPLRAADLAALGHVHAGARPLDHLGSHGLGRRAAALPDPRPRRLPDPRGTHGPRRG